MLAPLPPLSLHFIPRFVKGELWHFHKQEKKRKKKDVENSRAQNIYSANATHSGKLTKKRSTDTDRCSCAMGKKKIGKKNGNEGNQHGRAKKSDVSCDGEMDIFPIRGVLAHMCVSSSFFLAK